MSGIMICPCCGEAWDTEEYNACSCGASIESPTAVAEPNAHSVLSEVQAKVDERAFWFDWNDKYIHVIKYDELMKILSEHFR